jgi:hypothetical protein
VRVASLSGPGCYNGVLSPGKVAGRKTGGG